jgi:large subunit ribosomal protein L9
LKVILLSDIKDQGKMGDVINVKEGYARNYLIPRKMVKEATPGNMKTLDGILKKRVAAEAKVLAEANELAEKISALSITITAQAGEEDKLFGSVSSEMISEALSAEGLSIDKRDIDTGEQIKKLGDYNISVKVHPNVKATLKVSVIKT